MEEEIVMNVLLLFMCFRASYTIENSISLSTSSHNGFLMLQCQVKNNECCHKAMEIEFKKNGDGVCDLRECTGAFAIPLTRDDTKYYRCFCPGSDFHRAHLLITEIRLSDYGSWTCECTDSDTDKVCESNVLVVSDTLIKEDIAPVSNIETESKLFDGLIVSIVVLVLLFGVFLSMLLVVRFYISRRVKIVRENCLTKLCLGRGEEGTNSEKQDLMEILSFIRSGTYSTDKPRWCICSVCEEREHDSEKLCCGRVECITLHQDFETYCFAGISDEILNDSKKQREKRIRAYENYMKWGYGIIAAEQRFVNVPSCCARKIRNKFPDPKGDYRYIEKESAIQNIPDSAYPIDVRSHLC